MIISSCYYLSAISTHSCACCRVDTCSLKQFFLIQNSSDKTVNIFTYTCIIASDETNKKKKKHQQFAHTDKQTNTHAFCSVSLLLLLCLTIHTTVRKIPNTVSTIRATNTDTTHTTITALFEARVLCMSGLLFPRVGLKGVLSTEVSLSKR